jgi:hypothetical protein
MSCSQLLSEVEWTVLAAKSSSNCNASDGIGVFLKLC